MIQGGERGVGRQLALDGMKAPAIQSCYSLLDGNIIHCIIVEYGCRRGAKHPQRPIVIASLASFTFRWIRGFRLCQDPRAERRASENTMNADDHSVSFSFFSSGVK